MMDELPDTVKTSWTSKKLYELERGVGGIGHSIKDGVLRGLHLGRRGTADETELGDRDETRPTTADTFVVDKPGAASTSRFEDSVAASSVPAPISGPEPTVDSIVNLNLDSVHNYDSDVSNDNGDNEITEVPRGRRTSRRTLNSSKSSSTANLTPPPTIPLSYSHLPPSPRSRPRTAPTCSTPPSVVPVSRPGTGDGNGIRHHRLDSILGAGGQSRRPPTRESSPSRLVRFVDNGEDV